MEIADDDISQCSDESLVLVRINVPDLGVQKCMQFHRDELVWDAKQQVLAALPKEMKESFNCGLYCPPLNGRAGKFLDEERPLSDYPFPGPIGYLELKYKRRVYKMMNVDEKQIKQLHTKANLRRLLDFVQSGQAEKITKLCVKGLDPNFHCHETGDTPLSLATAQKKCNKTILALANGGALLDYRTRDGVTALHRAIEKNNLEAIKTLLDLGASPNYRDNKGLTPLYYSVLYNADSHVCELLLHDHAVIGAADLQGWQEVHQACRNGLVQHLEHLLFYGADMNARNASGNTPLHVCSVNEQESCARVLLFRGTDKEALNYANQTPYQVAVIAGNLALAEIINNHRAEDVVPFREPPKYNPRRRASIASSSALNRTHSDPRLEITLGLIKPPSPSPSNRSLPPFSSASSLSETSTGSSSTCTQPSNEDSEDTASVSVITEKSVASDSSGVCVNTTCASGGYEFCPERPAPMDAPLVPGLMCVCLENYSTDFPDHLLLAQGDIIEVTGSTDCGLLEGIFKGQRGFFPAACVQEVRLRHPELRCPRRVEGRRETSLRHTNQHLQQIQHKQEEQQQQQPQQLPQQQPLTGSPLTDTKRLGEPRTVVLHKSKKGFGFVLRGAKATSPLMELQPCENCPALQYLDDVDKGGVADLSGLKRGDFLLSINGEDVSQASHEHVVNLIRRSGELVSMSVVTVPRPTSILLDRPQQQQQQPMAGRQCATLPRKLMRNKAAPAPPRRDPRTTLSVGRARARSMVAGLAEIEALDRTLMEYDSEGRSTKSSSIESLPNKQLRSSDSLPAKTSTTANNNNNNNVISGLALANRVSVTEQSGHDSNSALHSPKVYGSVAQMKRYKASKHRIGDSPSKIHKVFHSTPDLNEMDLPPNVVHSMVNSKNCQRRSHSQEDMAVIQLNGRNVQISWAAAEKSADAGGDGKGPWHSIEEIYNRVLASEGEMITRSSVDSVDAPHPPPPTHPPPPPPVGQVVRVDVSRSRSEYAKVTVTSSSSSSDEPTSKPPPTSVMSSFRPGDSAKLYASPQEIGIIGYHAPPTRQQQQQQQQVTSNAHHHHHHPPPPTVKSVSTTSLRSRSLPPNVPPPAKTSSPSSSTSSETETSGDSASYTCSTFKKPLSQALVAPDTVSTDSGLSSERMSHVSGSVSSIVRASTTTSQYAQPGVPYHHQHHPQDLPYIPEPDYDLSDEDLGAALNASPPAAPTPPPPPPEHPPPAPVRIQQAVTGIQHPVQSSSNGVVQQPTPKKPPTPPAKRRDKTSFNPLPTPAKSQAGKQAAAMMMIGEALQQRGGTTMDLVAQTVTGKPPPTGAKIVKACSSAPTSQSASSSPSAVHRSESVAVGEASDFKELIAKKAAERQRRASLTSFSSPDSPKKEEPMSISQTPMTPVTATASTNLGVPLQESPGKDEPVTELPPPPPPPPASLTNNEDLVINVKEKISVFEHKVESAVKTSPLISRTASVKNHQEPCKLLKGSHSQVFEGVAKMAESVRQLKPSKSCPHDLTQDQDNSSSGGSSSSDAEMAGKRHSTKVAPPLPKASGDESDDDSDEMMNGAWNLKAKITETTTSSSDAILREELEAAIASRRILTKNTAVSLHRLSPPIETGETDAESDVTEPPTPPPAESINGSEPSSPDPISSGPISSKVVTRLPPQQQQQSSRAPASTPMKQQQQQQQHQQQQQQHQNRRQTNVRPTATGVVEDKIQQSLKLIKMHANSLQAVNSLTGLVPPPPEFDERMTLAAACASSSSSSTDSDFSMIAPPPEFSDDVHIPIKKDRRIMLEDAEIAAKSTATALAAAAGGGIHLTCPAAAAAAAAAASKLPTVRQASSGGVIHKTHPISMKTPPMSTRQMTRPPSSKMLPPPSTAVAACNGVPSMDDYHHYHHQQHPPHHHYQSYHGQHHSSHPPEQGPPPYMSQQSCGGPVKFRPPMSVAGPPPTTPAPPPPVPHKEFRTKPVPAWTVRDVSDWLESLLLPEYKARFEAAGVDGRRLTYMDNTSLAELGVKRVGHRMNIERSLRRHSMMKQ